MFDILTELQPAFTEHVESIEKLMTWKLTWIFYQSRVGKVHKEIGDKLKEPARRTEKPELDKNCFETENLHKWFRGQSCRAFEAERFPGRKIDETPAQISCHKNSYYSCFRYCFSFHVDI